MTEQLGLNLGAVEGMTRAKDHAEREHWGWGEEALDYLRGYLRMKPPRFRFLAPEMRVWAIQHGLSAPASNYAWGSVFWRARRLGLIVPDGYEQYGDDKMHTQSVRAWRAVP